MYCFVYSGIRGLIFLHYLDSYCTLLISREAPRSGFKKSVAQDQVQSNYHLEF
jgi:hypothetical protein